MEDNKMMEENYNEVMEENNSGIMEENQKNKTPDKSKKKFNAKIVVIVAVVLAVIAAGVLGAMAIKSKNEQEAKKKQEEQQSKKQEQLDTYYNNMEEAAYMMLSGAADSEELGNLIVSVWSNSIYETEDEATDIYTMENGVFLEDFNDALGNLFASDEYAELQQTIEDNKESVTELMKKLVNPPEEYKESYSLMEKYYESYLKFVKHVIDSEGSLNSFSDEFGELDDEVIGYYEKIKLHLK